MYLYERPKYSSFSTQGKSRSVRPYRAESSTDRYAPRYQESFPRSYQNELNYDYSRNIRPFRQDPPPKYLYERERNQRYDMYDTYDERRDQGRQMRHSPERGFRPSPTRTSYSPSNRRRDSTQENHRRSDDLNKSNSFQRETSPERNRHLSTPSPPKFQLPYTSSSGTPTQTRRLNFFEPSPAGSSGAGSLQEGAPKVAGESKVLSFHLPLSPSTGSQSPAGPSPTMAQSLFRVDRAALPQTQNIEQSTALVVRDGENQLDRDSQQNANPTIDQPVTRVETDFDEHQPRSAVERRNSVYSYGGEEISFFERIFNEEYRKTKLPAGFLRYLKDVKDQLHRSQIIEAYSLELPKFEGPVENFPRDYKSKLIV